MHAHYSCIDSRVRGNDIFFVSNCELLQKVIDLAKQYGVSDKSIYGWMRQDTGEEVVSLAKYSKLKRENEELKRLIGELTLDASWKKKS